MVAFSAISNVCHSFIFRDGMWLTNYHVLVLLISTTKAPIDVCMPSLSERHVALVENLRPLRRRKHLM